MANPQFKLQPDIARSRPADPDPLSISESSGYPLVVGYAASIAMTAVATLLAVSIDLGIKIPNLSLIFVVPVIVAGVGFGLGPSICSAVLGALSYNFFLTEPRYSLAVDDPANIWAISLLFVVGLIVSGVAYTSGRRAIDAARARNQVVTLQGYGRDVSAAATPDRIVSLTSLVLTTIFHVPAVVMLVSEGKVISATPTAGLEELQEAEYGAALSSLAMGTVMRAGVYPTLTSRLDFWPVPTSTGKQAVIGLAFDPDDRPAAPETLVEIVACFLTLALDRLHGSTR